MLKEYELDNIKSCRALCELEDTTINGIDLEYEDFGDKFDTNPARAKRYGCGNMQFVPFNHVKQNTLVKYNITEDEYRRIQERLKCLSFGKCDWCV